MCYSTTIHFYKVTAVETSDLMVQQYKVFNTHIHQTESLSIWSNSQFFVAKVCVQFYFKPELYTQYNRDLDLWWMHCYCVLVFSSDEWPVVRADIQRCWTITLITQSSHTWHYATHVIWALPSVRAIGRQKRWTLWEDIHQGYCKGSPCWSQKQVCRKLWLLMISWAKSRDCSRQLFNASTWSIHFSLMSFHDNL